MPSKPLRSALPLLTLGLGAAVGVLVSAPRPAGAGCLAPRDVLVDPNGTSGPFWGNDRGDLLYTQVLSPGEPSQRFALRIAPGSGGNLIVVEQNEDTGGLLGAETERYVAFHGGAMNDSGDVAVVASTAADDDDESTTANETIPRRGLFFRRGALHHRIARFGEPSPVLDGDQNPVPWASIFDATPSDRAPTFSQVIFSAQLGQPDGRTGLFLWDESLQTVTTLALEGDSAPSGGVFTSFGRTRINGAGDAAFFALTQVGDGTPDSGLFVREADGEIERQVVFGANGDTSPGGDRFTLLRDFDLDDVAEVTFVSALAGGAADAGVFRRAASGAVSTLLLEGEPTLLGGQYVGVDQARVRASGDGTLVVGVSLTEDIGGDGVFLFEVGQTSPVPLANTEPLDSVAILAGNGAAYQAGGETRSVVPATGDDEGPSDFRIAKLDLRNSPKPGADVLLLDGRLTLPAFPADGPEPKPASFRTDGVSVLAPSFEYTGGTLSRVARVTLVVSSGPGNTYVFGLSDGTAAPTGTYSFNGTPGAAPRVKLDRTGRAASWQFSDASGRGTFTVDLAAGTFALKLSKGNVRESYDAANFPVSLTLATADDVTAGRTGEAAWFHRAVVVQGDQPNFGQGRRVRSQGERIEGGTVFVDALTVKRKLKPVKGAAAPDVTSDAVQLSGTLRICPGATPPNTPSLSASFGVGDAQFADIVLTRQGRSGSRYRFRSAKGVVPSLDLFVDVERGQFKARITNAPPLSQLVNADFSGATPTNGVADDVGGMSLPFLLEVSRVYATTSEVPVVRRKGAKVFSR